MNKRDLFTQERKYFKYRALGYFVIDLLDFPGKDTFLRKSGNTTKQVDHAIQLLFSEKTFKYAIECTDHYKNGTHRESNERLFDLIYRRLNTEHPWLMPQVKADKKDLIIYIDKPTETNARYKESPQS